MEIQVPDLIEVKIGDAVFKCKSLTTKEMKAITAKYTKSKPYRGQLTEKTDDVAASEQMFVDQVQDWEGIKMGGKAAECDENNKRYLFRNHADLGNQIMAAVDEEKEKLREGVEVDSKNFGDSPSASSDSAKKPS